MLTHKDLEIGGYYNWKYQKERLVYLGKAGNWHQFAKREYPTLVWCEVLSADIEMFEVTND